MLLDELQLFWSGEGHNPGTELDPSDLIFDELNPFLVILGYLSHDFSGHLAADLLEEILRCGLERLNPFRQQDRALLRIGRGIRIWIVGPMGRIGGDRSRRADGLLEFLGGLSKFSSGPFHKLTKLVHLHSSRPSMLEFHVLLVAFGRQGLSKMCVVINSLLRKIQRRKLSVIRLYVDELHPMHQLFSLFWSEMKFIEQRLEERPLNLRVLGDLLSHAKRDSCRWWLRSVRYRCRRIAGLSQRLDFWGSFRYTSFRGLNGFVVILRCGAREITPVGFSSLPELIRDQRENRCCHE